MPLVGDVTKTIATKKLRAVASWRVEVTTGPSRGLVKSFAEGVIRVGSAESNEIVLDDRKVSRHHLVLELRSSGLKARDLGSKNGTFYQRLRIDVADLPASGAVITVGESDLRLSPEDEAGASSTSQKNRCGGLVGGSERMRALYAQIERIAPTSATVLLQGETGSGKDLAAQALHALSERKDRPFVVVDCGAIARELIESELFGHVRGAFTGAVGDRRGAFELAHGGTVFLDEIGELPLDLQPRLLRVLETGKVKPVGSERVTTCDVRVVAASLRDLGQLVQEGRFREDLFYRLSVVRIEVPPLRAHLEDLPMLVEQFLTALGAPPLPPEGMRALASSTWPGNVRQLKNVLERVAALAGGGPLEIRPEDLELPAPVSGSAPFGAQLPYKVAKDEVLARFTKEYLQALLVRNGGNVSAAAREAQVDRNWIVALARRHGVRVRDA
jgi:transcriptional regulator with GAF, ATPase, and Fis domain